MPADTGRSVVNIDQSSGIIRGDVAKTRKTVRVVHWKSKIATALYPYEFSHLSNCDQLRSNPLAILRLIHRLSMTSKRWDRDLSSSSLVPHTSPRRSGLLLWLWFGGSGGVYDFENLGTSSMPNLFTV